MKPEDLAYFVDYTLAVAAYEHPFSRGDFTFATNGHVMVRVPRIAGISEVEDAPDPTRVMDKLDLASCTRAMPRLPPLRHFVENDPEDDGTKFLALWRETATLQGNSFDLHYLHLIAWLDGLRIGMPQGRREPMPFTFTGGTGALMPCEKALETHHHLDAAGR